MDSISQAKRIHSDFNRLLTWFLSIKSCYVYKEEPWNIGLLARVICNQYAVLPRIDIKLEKSSISVELLNSEEYYDMDSYYLSPIVRLKDYVNDKLSDFIYDFLVHGSISTLDYSKGWSDLDTLVIVNNETFSDPNKLIKFRKGMIDAHSYLLQIDVHQHHGFIYCTEAGLNQYFSHYMPLEVLAKSKSLLSDNILNISHNREVVDAVLIFRKKNVLLESAYTDKVLRHHKYNNEYLRDNYKNPEAMYQLKYFLSIVMTLPALYLDAKGCPAYKKNSFEIVKYDFEEFWGIVEKASRIREAWPDKEVFPYVGNNIPDWIINVLGDNYFKEAYELSNAMHDSLIA
jgi:hypothetical protein